MSSSLARRVKARRADFGKALSIVLDGVSFGTVRVRGTTAAVIAGLALAGCSGSDDSYSQKQLDLAIERAEADAEQDGFRRGLREGELRALERAGMGGADGWWSVRMKGGLLPDSQYESSPLEINRAIHLCDFDPEAVCSVDPTTGESLSNDGG